MDHSFWPFVTTKLYLDQTGDLDVLFEKIPYLRIFSQNAEQLMMKNGTAVMVIYRKQMLMKYIMELFWNIFFFKICAHFLMWEIIMKCVCMEQTGMMP